MKEGKKGRKRRGGHRRGVKMRWEGKEREMEVEIMNSMMEEFSLHLGENIWELIKTVCF